MIDYIKLERAHELAEKHAKQTGKHTEITVSHYENYNPDYGYTIYDNDESYDGDQYVSLEDLIIKLKELIGPEPKYKEGDVVYVLQDKNYIAERHIKHIQAYKDSWVYTFTNLELCTEDFIYPSCEELIKAQLKFWQSLKDIDDLSHLKVCKKCSGRTATNHMMLGGNPNCDHAFEDEKSVTECQHESDGLMYTSNPPKLKCEKCGEFYR